MILHHPNCKDSDCHVCFEDHTTLGAELASRTADHSVDHLGLYHRWLSKHGINPETEWGWATPETFEETNIHAYVMEHIDATHKR